MRGRLISLEGRRMEMVATKEQRRRARLAVRWVVRFHKGPPGKAIECRTRDISSDGFYCVSETEFTTGEKVDCTIVIPKQDGYSIEGGLSLECNVQVVRVEAIEAGGAFGIGCKIVDYSVIPLRSPTLSNKE